VSDLICQFHTAIGYRKESTRSRHTNGTPEDGASGILGIEM